MAQPSERNPHSSPSSEFLRMKVLLTLKKMKEARAKTKAVEADPSSSLSETQDAFMEAAHWGLTYRMDTEAFSRASCQELCANFHTKLPREIRDIVYHYISVQEVVVPGETGLSQFQRSKSYPKTRVEEHYWDPAFVTFEVAKELTENFYRTSCFNFGNHPEVIPNFLTQDQWNLGITPSDFVVDARLELRWCDYDFEYREQKPHHYLWDVKPLPEKLYDIISSLLYFKNGAKLSIDINTGRGFEYDVQSRHAIFQVIEVIFPDLVQLKDAGYRLRLFLDQKYEITSDDSNFTIEAWYTMLEEYDERKAVELMWRMVPRSFNVMGLAHQSRTAEKCVEDEPQQEKANPVWFEWL